MSDESVSESPCASGGPARVWVTGSLPVASDVRAAGQQPVPPLSLALAALGQLELQVQVQFKLLCFALLSSHFQVKPTHSLHTTTDKLSRHAYTLPCPVRGGSYDAI